LYHADLHVPGGFMGVDVFFVISGFVITGLLLRELEARRSLDLLHFYARRIRRLLPALATMVIVVAVVGVLASPTGSQVVGAHTGIAASVFAANLYLYRLGTGYFDLGTTFDPLLHTWTLGVEEQFYIVFPTLLFVCWWLARGRQRVVAFVAIACISVASLGLALILGSGGGSSAGHRFAFYGSPTRAWEFGVGALLAITGTRLASLSPGLLGLLGAVGVALLGAAAFMIHGTSDFVDWRMLLPVVGALALLTAGLSGRTAATRLLSTGPLVWVGDLSYSWYLWHWPVIVFARALFPGAPVSVGAALLSIVPSWLSYHYVENPIRFSTPARGVRTVSLATVCIVAPIAACIGLLGVHDLLWRTSALKRWEAVQAVYLSSDRGCESSTPLGERTAARWSLCTWTVPHPRGRIVLLGDSNAAQLTEPVIRAGTRSRYDVTVAPRTGCSFIDLLGVWLGDVGNSCYRFDSATLSALERDPPDVVVLANRDDFDIAKPAQGWVRADGTITYDLAEKARLWQQGLARVLVRLNRAGVRVVLVRPVPLMPLAPAGCAVIRVLLSSCESSLSRTDVDHELEPAARAQKLAALHASLTHIVDFEPQLCSKTRCSTVRKRTILYFDRDHLNRAGALTLTDRFQRIFASLHARTAIT
jgi:peptidoglycan/LPS O-acetylase OafA/YrhL